MRLVSIVGARPQFVKLAPVSRMLRQQHEELIIHTGQHYDYRMSALFFEELALPEPDYHLHVGSGPHGKQTALMLDAIEQVLLETRPDWVVVFGDTNSTLAGALAAAKLHIPIAHVEAGLRSYNRTMPEEINRIVTDHLSQRLFCPTETASKHLEQEGMTAGVEMVGDVMYDILLQMQPKLASNAQALLPALRVQSQHFVLATVHRASNTDDAEAMHRIADALNQLAMPVIFPIHPRTQARMAEYDITWSEHIHFIEPVGYLDMLTLEKSARCVITDSGGVQKEAFFLNTPCVTLREETEWPETVELGWNILVGTPGPTLVEAVYRNMPAPSLHHPFGYGNAAERIAKSFQ